MEVPRDLHMVGPSASLDPRLRSDQHKTVLDVAVVCLRRLLLFGHVGIRCRDKAAPNFVDVDEAVGERSYAGNWVMTE